VSSRGNMTSDGTRTFAYDAENRLISIVYPGSGNHSDFTIDPLGRRVKILEYTSSSLTSTKQFVWSFGDTPRESRDSSSSIISQYYKLGQMDTTNKRFYTLNQLGSITEVTDSSGNVLGQFGYSPFGQQSQLQGSYVPDFGFAGYYLHARSGLNLTRTRAYSASLGRFINRDPVEERGGLNLFEYVSENPINFRDPSGMLLGVPRTAPDIPSAVTCGARPMVRPFNGKIDEHGNDSPAVDPGPANTIPDSRGPGDPLTIPVGH